MITCIQDPGAIKFIVLIWSTGSLLMWINRISIYSSVNLELGELNSISAIVLSISVTFCEWL